MGRLKSMGIKNVFAVFDTRYLKEVLLTNFHAYFLTALLRSIFIVFKNIISRIKNNLWSWEAITTTQF